MIICIYKKVDYKSCLTRSPNLRQVSPTLRQASPNLRIIITIITISTLNPVVSLINVNTYIPSHSTPSHRHTNVFSAPNTTKTRSLLSYSLAPPTNLSSSAAVANYKQAPNQSISPAEAGDADVSQVRVLVCVCVCVSIYVYNRM